MENIVLYGVYIMNNGCIINVFKKDNILIDENGFEITENELNEYRKII